jgi:hypothetical protein
LVHRFISLSRDRGAAIFSILFSRLRAAQHRDANTAIDPRLAIIAPATSALQIVSDISQLLEFDITGTDHPDDGFSDAEVLLSLALRPAEVRTIANELASGYMVDTLFHPLGNLSGLRDTGESQERSRCRADHFDGDGGMLKSRSSHWSSFPSIGGQRLAVASRPIAGLVYLAMPDAAVLIIQAKELT